MTSRQKASSGWRGAIRWLAVGVLMGTALLKIAYLVTTPIGGGARPDPVLGILSQRETLLAAAFLELVAAWLGGFLLVRACSGRLGGRSVVSPAKKVPPALWLVAASVLVLPGRGSGAGETSVRVQGRVTITTWYRKGALTEQQRFEALVDRERLLLRMPRWRFAAAERYGVQSSGCETVEYVDRETNCGFIRCEDGVVTFRFQAAEYPNQLANWGDTPGTCIFLALRSAELFPEPRGRRQVAPPWTIAGELMSLVFEGEYQWEGNADARSGLELRYVVSGDLLKNCQQSRYRSVFVDHVPEVRERELALVERYRPGFVGGVMRLSGMTNVGGILLARQADFEVYPRPGTSVAAAQSTSGHTNSYQVVIDSVEMVSEPVVLLPIEAPVIYVIEDRLQDRELGIGFVRYQTNRIASFQISPVARAQFEARRAAGLRERWLKRFEEAFMLVLAAALITVPLALGIHRLRRRTGTDSRGKRQARMRADE